MSTVSNVSVIDLITTMQEEAAVYTILIHGASKVDF